MLNIVKKGEHKVTIEFTLDEDTSEGELDELFTEAMYSSFDRISSSNIGIYESI